MVPAHWLKKLVIFVVDVKQNLIYNRAVFVSLKVFREQASTSIWPLRPFYHIHNKRKVKGKVIAIGLISENESKDFLW